jgi:hypothetical protein
MNTPISIKQVAKILQKKHGYDIIKFDLTHNRKAQPIPSNTRLSFESYVESNVHPSEYRNNGDVYIIEKPDDMELEYQPAWVSMIIHDMFEALKDDSAMDRKYGQLLLYIPS